MPGKSRRNRKGKYSIQNKKQVGSLQSNPNIRQPLAAQVHQTTPIGSMPAAPRAVPTRPARAAEPMAKPAAIRYAFVATELRNIGILAALMLILLFVLARVLA